MKAPVVHGGMPGRTARKIQRKTVSTSPRGNSPVAVSKHCRVPNDIGALARTATTHRDQYVTVTTIVSL